MRTHAALALLSLAAAVPAFAQQTLSYFGGNESSSPVRSFILEKDSKILSANGEWHDIERLKAYSTTHAGSYILFADKDGLHRLDSPAQVAEAERLYQPLRELSAQQAILSAKQRPLGDQQAALGQQQAAAGQQMRSAAISEMGSIGRTQGAIGHEQGIVGRAQGDIGREQGVIGRQQGIAGRKFYEQVQGMLDDCLARHTCSVVSEKTD